MEFSKVLAVVGPTASGKTWLAVQLAKKFNGEIISCDSMQIYRYMTVGTAKPTALEMEGIPHHLVDFLDPDQPFSVAEYVELARAKASEVLGAFPGFVSKTTISTKTAAAMIKTEIVLIIPYTNFLIIYYLSSSLALRSRRSCSAFTI